MKRFLISLVTVLAVASCQKQPQVLTVKGHAAIPDAQEMVLYQVGEGQWDVVTKVPLDAEGNYEFTVSNPKPGMWSLAYAPTQSTSDFQIDFLVENSGELTINIGEQLWEYEITGNLSKNAKIFEEWHRECLSVFPAFSTDNTFEKVFPKLDDFFAKAKDLAGQIQCKDKALEEYLKLYLLTEAKFKALRFRMMPNRIHPTIEQLHPFYREVESLKLDRDEYASLPFMARLVATLGSNYLQNHEYLSLGLSTALAKQTEYIDSLMTSQRVRGTNFAWNVSHNQYKYRPFEEFEADYQKYSDCLSAAQLKTVEAFRNANRQLGMGNPAIDFTFPDSNGKKHSLSDFKGKVVVVDVWATWCGPCMKEVPYLQKLEQELAGKDVVFIGVSRDSEKDMEKWKNTLKEKEMDGIQLFAGQGEAGQSFGAAYQITTIPRFMVFDQAGKIVSVNAPRPSDPALKQMILGLLQ